MRQRLPNATTPSWCWTTPGSRYFPIVYFGILKGRRVAISGGSAGLSETSPVVSLSVYGEQPRVGSIGVPIPGVEMKLIDRRQEEGA
ncbi:hypothetical protein [Streptomyces werraensis]|uniref:hypothetical protein n=1 Tax=Streptomyces werraensis TaxID=68284 RepID=UPI001CE37336